MKIIIAILCFFLTFTLYGQVNDADAFFSGDYNKAFISSRNISRVSVETFINGSKSARSIFEFDSNGLLTKQTIFDSSGKKINGYLFKYNRYGHQTERKNIAYELNKTFTTSFRKTYSGLNLVEETSSEFPFITTYLYDEKGKKIQATIYIAKDTVTSAKRVSLFAYDAKGKLTAIDEAYIENKSAAPVNTGKTIYVYDEAGNITEVIREGKAGYALSYTADGLLKSKTIKMPEEFSPVNIIESYRYTYRK